MANLGEFLRRQCRENVELFLREVHARDEPLLSARRPSGKFLSKLEYRLAVVALLPQTQCGAFDIAVADTPDTGDLLSSGKTVQQEAALPFDSRVLAFGKHVSIIAGMAGSSAGPMLGGSKGLRPRLKGFNPIRCVTEVTYCCPSVLGIP